MSNDNAPATGARTSGQSRTTRLLNVLTDLTADRYADRAGVTAQILPPAAPPAPDRHAA